MPPRGVLLEPETVRRHAEGAVAKSRSLPTRWLSGWLVKRRIPGEVRIFQHRHRLAIGQALIGLAGVQPTNLRPRFALKGAGSVAVPTGEFHADQHGQISLGREDVVFVNQPDLEQRLGPFSW